MAVCVNSVDSVPRFRRLHGAGGYRERRLKGSRSLWPLCESNREGIRRCLCSAQRWSQTTVSTQWRAMPAFLWSIRGITPSGPAFASYIRALSTMGMDHDTAVSFLGDQMDVTGSVGPTDQGGEPSGTSSAGNAFTTGGPQVRGSSKDPDRRRLTSFSHTQDDDRDRIFSRSLLPLSTGECSRSFETVRC